MIFQASVEETENGDYVAWCSEPAASAQRKSDDEDDEKQASSG